MMGERVDEGPLSPRIPLQFTAGAERGRSLKYRSIWSA